VVDKQAETTNQTFIMLSSINPDNVIRNVTG